MSDAGSINRVTIELLNQVLLHAAVRKFRALICANGADTRQVIILMARTHISSGRGMMGMQLDGWHELPWNVGLTRQPHGFI